MRLLELDIQAFRRFAGRVGVRLKPEGLTVLSGDNEEGKSSVLAALEAVLFEAHRVGGKVLAAMRPWSGGDPKIAARFLLKGREWRIEKRFGQAPWARLFEDGREVASGALAEQRLAELLQFEPRQSRSEARPEHRGLFGLFWLQQGTGLHGFEVPHVLRRPLAGAIAAELDAAAGGDRLAAVLDLVRSRAEALLTPGQRRETGELRELAKECEAIRQMAEELDQRWRIVEAKVVELERLRDEGRCVAHRNELEEARLQLSRLEQRKAEIDQLAAEVRLARAEAAQRRSELAALEDKRNGRQDLRDQIEAAVRDEARLAQDKEVLSGALEREEAELAAVREQQAARAAEARALEERVAVLRRAVERTRLGIALARADTDRSRLAEINERLAEIRRKLEAVRVTPELVEALRRAATDAALARAALEAAATQLEFRPEPGRRVLCEGRELVIDSPYLVTEPAVFMLEGFGRLGVRPGAADLGKRQQQLARAEARVARLLDAAGVADLAAAEALLRQQAEWRQQAGRLDDERRLLLERHDAHSESELDARRAALAARLQEAGEEPANAGAEAEDVLSQLEDRQRQMRAAAEALAAEVVRRGEVVHTTRVELARLDAAARHIEGRRIRLCERLAAEEAKLPDAVLEGQLAAAREELAKAEFAYVTLQRELERLDPRSLEEQLARQRRRVAGLEAEERQRRERIAALEAELRALGDSDLAEQRERAKGERERLEQAYRRRRREAEAWWLLRERLEAAQRSRQKAFTRPVVERTLPWLQRLFPDAGLELDPDRLVITGLDRQGLREPFWSLSIGTREQLAVLVRLALASLVGEARGEPPCLVLDDALVYADEQRFKAMKEILECAARETRMQILVLTCRPRDWMGIEAEFQRLANCSAPLSE